MPTVDVNPEILLWARETAGLSLPDAVAKVGIRPARGVEAVDRLAAMERGDEQPTRPLLVRMAKQYRRPLLAFYLNAPPPTGDRGSDFRTLPDGRPPEEDALVDALIRDVRSSQAMVRAGMEAEDEAEPLPFVGALRNDDGTGSAASLHRALRSKPKASRLAKRAAQLLGQILGEKLNAVVYHAQPSADQAFELLRTRVEAAGVFVLLQGDLGSHHTTIDVGIFRGFAIADDIAPFVVINHNDARAAWSFTLLHELTHLLIGQTGISGALSGNALEVFCNRVAAEWLLPPETLDQLDFESEDSPIEQRSRIGDFARRHNLSGTMVAYRLYQTERIDQPAFDRLRTEFRELWQREQRRKRERARKSTGGPNYYAVRRHRVGSGLLRFVHRMIDSGALSTTKAARILGVKPAHVGTMLEPERVR